MHTAPNPSPIPPAHVSPWAAWEIDAATFPHAGSHAEKLRFCLGYAVLAPSSHNTQPWLFRIRDDAVELYADRSRALHVSDPGDRELTISCGAALHHLRIALAHFGHLGRVDLLPDPSDQDLLARVHLGFTATNSPVDARVFQAMPRRRTNRQPFRQDPVPAPLLSDLADAARHEDTWFREIKGSDTLFALADLIAEGDRRQWANKRFRLELAAWAHPNRVQACDGIPGYAMGLDDILSCAGPLVIRTFDLGEGQAARDREIAHGSPAMIAIGTAGDNLLDWLRAGQALSAVLLRARADDVWASYLNQPLELPDLRVQATRLLSVPGYTQIILRLGYGNDIRPTPRRTVDQVVL